MTYNSFLLESYLTWRYPPTFLIFTFLGYREPFGFFLNTQVAAELGDGFSPMDWTYVLVYWTTVLDNKPPQPSVTYVTYKSTVSDLWWWTFISCMCVGSDILSKLKASLSPLDHCSTLCTASERWVTSQNYLREEGFGSLLSLLSPLLYCLPWTSLPRVDRDQCLFSSQVDRHGTYLDSWLLAEAIIFCSTFLYFVF